MSRPPLPSDLPEPPERPERPAPKATRRPFRTRWAVIGFVVLALVVCSIIMALQLSGDDTPDEPDSSPSYAGTTASPGGG